MPRSSVVPVGVLLLWAGPWAARPASAEWLEARKILGADTAAHDLFGSALTLDGDRLAVGVPRDDSPLGDAGSVYLFDRNNGGPERWGQAAKLTASDAWSASHFGAAIALDGGTLVAGASGADNNLGAAYIFERQADGQWAQTAKLARPPDPDTDTFGDSVAIKGDTVFVGSVGDNEKGQAAGAVWVYELHGPTHGALVAKLTAQNPSPDARLGWASAVAGGILAVGAPKDWEAAIEAGAVHIFDQHGSGAWLEVAKLMASDADIVDQLGIAVAISGGTVVAGAPGSGTAGAAYVFERGGSAAWVEVAKLIASDAKVGDRFGTSVAIYQDRIVVGAEGEDEPGVASGAAYLFERQADGSWTELLKLEASDAADTDNFGYSVVAGPATVIVGAENDDDAGLNSGSAYVFLEREVGMSLAGLCPGEVTLTITGATPLAPVAVLHGEEGMSGVPGGPCVGTQLGLATPRLAGVGHTDLTGGLTVTHVMESQACGRSVQVLDLATCAVSDVAALP